MELGEVVDLFDSLRIPLSRKERATRSGPFPYYGASGVIDHIDDHIFDGRYLLIAEDGENLNSRKTPIAFLADGRFWVNNHAHVVRGVSGVADDYFLMSWFAAANISGFVTGTAQPKLSQSNLRRIRMNLPPLPTQRKIAAVLSAYDDLIANNLRRIEILEAMARAIYREWFVEFRFPGHEDVAMVESELGSIPEGWAAKPLGEILGLAYGKGLKASDRRGGSVGIFGSGGLVGYHDEPLVKGPGIVVGRKGNVGSVYWSDSDFYPIDTTYYVETTYPLTFVFYVLDEQEFIDSHAAVPGLSRDQAYRIPLVVPPSGIAQAFDVAATDLYRLRANLRRRANVLRQTRDLLLPKLVSGAIDVSDLDIDTGDLAA